MSDRVKLQGIMEQGYGIAPKLVMRDKKLSIEAKAIYAYIASFAGGKDTAFPRVKTVCEDLGISENRFFSHRKALVDRGYITIEKNRKGGKFQNNIYILNSTVPSNHRHGESPARQNEGTNNNKVLNNNKYINSSSNAFGFYESNFGMITPFIADKISDWVNALSEELVIESMKIALTNNKQFNYAEGILRDWHKRNVKTLSDVKALEKEFKRKKDTKGRLNPSEIDWSDI